MRVFCQGGYLLEFNQFKTIMRVFCQGAILTCGLVLILVGAVVKWSIFPGIINKLILTNLDLSPGTEAYNNWAGEPSVDVLMKYYVFNVTNPEEVKKGEKAIVKDVGPFTYKEIRHKDHILSVNEHISYESFLDFVFLPDMSVGNDSMELTIINPLLASIPALINILGGIPQELDPILEFPLPWLCGGLPLTLCMNLALAGKWDCGENSLGEGCSEFTNIKGSFKDDIFNKVTAREIIFDGYTPGILNFALMLYDLANFVLDKFGPDIEAMNITIPELPELPPEVAGGSFALFSNSSTSWAKINSGRYQIEKYNSYVEYKGMTKLPDNWWADFGPTPNAHKSGIKGVCKDLVGTDVSAYPPFLRKDDDLWVFSSELCRSIWLSFVDEVDVKGINFYQYNLLPDVLNMSDPNNFCYCPGVQYCAVEVEGEDRWDLSGCLHCKDGLLNIMGCRVAPVVISTPHFLYSDSLSENLTGIVPDLDLHSTYSLIQPQIGVPLESHKRMQVNVPIYPWDMLDIMNNMTETIFPILWLDEGYDLDDDTAGAVKGYLVTPVLVIDISMYVIISFGGIIVLGVLLAMCVKNKKPAYVLKK